MMAEFNTAGTFFPTKTPGRAPSRNVTEIVYVSHDDITELTIIVWTVGGILLIALLALLGRIILARRKDPLSETGYERHRNNVFRIRLDSAGYLARPTEHGFVVPHDTNELVPGDATPPMESPVSQRYYSSRTTAQGNQRQGNPEISINSITTFLSRTTCNQAQSLDRANSINCNTRSNTVSTNNLTDPNAGNDDYHNNHGEDQLSCRAVYDAESNEETTNDHLERTSLSTVLQQQTNRAITSNTTTHAPHITNSANHHQNSDHIQNSERPPNCQIPHANAVHRPQTQTRTTGSTGSRVVLSNGVVICPPPYCDVISSTARLPSVVVSRPSRPPSRRLLFSL